MNIYEIEVDWDILCVFDNEKERKGFYTIGLKKYLGFELELYMWAENKICTQLLNIIGYSVKYKNFKITDGMIDTTLFNNRVLYTMMKPAYPPHGDESMVMRVILSDEKDILPIEEGCEEIFLEQLE